MRAAMHSNMVYGISLFLAVRHGLTLVLQDYVSANINAWQSLALSIDQTHFLFSYGEESSSALMYNLFSDLLLGMNLVPQSVCAYF